MCKKNMGVLLSILKQKLNLECLRKRQHDKYANVKKSPYKNINNKIVKKHIVNLKSTKFTLPVRFLNQSIALNKDLS